MTRITNASIEKEACTDYSYLLRAVDMLSSYDKVLLITLYCMYSETMTIALKFGTYKPMKKDNYY